MVRNPLMTTASTAFQSPESTGLIKEFAFEAGPDGAPIDADGTNPLPPTEEFSPIGDLRVEGTKGDDVLEGGPGDDTFIAGPGDDTVLGGEGADDINGKTGFDIVDYSFSNAAVSVSLENDGQPQSGGHAEGEILRSVEGVVGSNFGDRIIGDGARNLLDGGNGNDFLDGGRGADTLLGGNGNDTIVAHNDGAEVYDGGEGTDTLHVNSRVELRDDGINSIENLVIEASAGENALARLNSSQMGFETITFNSVNDRSAVVEVQFDTDDVDLSDITFNGFEAGRDRVEIVANGRDNRIIGSEADDFIRAGGGNDTVSTGDGNDDIRGGEGADDLNGGAGDDQILGEDGDDYIQGGEGADTLDGGNGRDTVSYTESDAGVAVSLHQGATAQRGGTAQGDVLRNIENVDGSQSDDVVTGNNGANVIGGFAGNDIIEGLGGADTIEAGSGDDMVIVGAGDGRVIDGGVGFDTLRVADRVGLQRNDEVTGFEALEIVGTAGRNALLRLDADQFTFEKITYESLNGRAAIIEIFGDDTKVLDFSTAELIGFDGQDEFRFYGSGSDEAVTGTALDDRLEGRNGNDVLNGGDGADLLFGQDGNDVLIGGAGSDRLDGGSGIDTVDYSASAEGIDIVLDNGNRRGDGGDAGGDQLISIENVIASAFDDLVRGSNADNRIEGGEGDDVVEGLGGNDVLIGEDGNDVLDGGRGEDLLIGGAGNDVLTGGTHADTFRFTDRDGFGQDVITDFEAIDLIQLLRDGDVTGFDDLEIFQTITELGGGETRTDTVIELDAGTITLQGVDFALQAGHFDFFG